MDREEDKKKTGEQSQQTTQSTDIKKGRHEDEGEHSYQGKLDHVEGQMNNGEIGGGIRKEEE